MRVISKPRLRDFWTRHPPAHVPLLVWWKIALKANWGDLQAVRRTFPHADAVELSNGAVMTVFNIGGNKYRLVVSIVYRYHVVYIKKVMTHAEYSAGRWKDELCHE